MLAGLAAPAREGYAAMAATKIEAIAAMGIPSTSESSSGLGITRLALTNSRPFGGFCAGGCTLQTR